MDINKALGQTMTICGLDLKKTRAFLIANYTLHAQEGLEILYMQWHAIILVR